ISKLDWVKIKKTKSSLKKTVAFTDEGSSNSDTDKIIARMDAMTIKILVFTMITATETRIAIIGVQADGMIITETTTDDKPYDLQKQFNDFMKSQQSTKAFVKETFMDLKTQLEIVAKNHQASIQNLETKFERLVDKQSGRPYGSLSSNTQPNPRGGKAYLPSQARNEHVNAIHKKCIDVIDEIFEEDFDALLDERSKIIYSVEGTLLEDEIFSEFNAFMAMTADENPKSESDNEEPPFEKITINIDYKIKTSLEEPPTDLEIIPLSGNLEYIFIEEPSFLPVIISSKLSAQNKSKLVSVLKKHKEAFAWKTTDIHGIYPSFCKHKIQPLDDKKPVIQKQRRLNSNMQEVVKKEIVKLLDNRALKRILKKTVKDNLAIWSRKLDDALWAFRTAYKIPTETTPYKLIYGKNCHLPFEIEHRANWALKNCNPDMIAAGEKRMFQLHKLDELRHQAYENSRLYKERTKVWHDRKLRMRKEFKHGNKFDNRGYSRESNKAYQATCKELINKEIDGPEVLNFVNFGNIHGGRALQELDEFYRTKIVDDKLDDSDEEVDSAEARRAQEENEGSPRRRPNMSFTNWLRVMDDRLGKNIRSIR
nr:reverse transcriptase domain-containing protein [Tanacetum cinerariifolium]